MQETWRPVLGFEGSYEVSDLGRVRSLDRYVRSKHNSLRPVRGQLMVCPVNERGYAVATLALDATKKMRIVHGLVAQAFLPADPTRKFVNHIDGNKLNNQATNLERCTHRENILHAYRTRLVVGRHSGERHKRAVLTDLIVREARALFRQGASPREAALSLNVPIDALRKVQTGKTWKHVT